MTRKEYVRLADDLETKRRDAVDTLFEEKHVHLYRADILREIFRAKEKAIAALKKDYYMS